METLLLPYFLSFLCMVSLVKFTSPNDDPLILDGANMFKLFGRGQQMESEIMDHIISYWKDDPEMKILFNSGHRILLGPFTILVFPLPIVFLVLCTTF